MAVGHWILSPSPFNGCDVGRFLERQQHLSLSSKLRNLYMYSGAVDCSYRQKEKYILSTRTLVTGRQPSPRLVGHSRGLQISLGSSSDPSTPSRGHVPGCSCRIEPVKTRVGTRDFVPVKQAAGKGPLCQQNCWGNGKKYHELT
jgi:hypothetical protein